MTKKVKITVIRKFSPEEVFGHGMIRQSTGESVPTCSLERGREFIVENHLEIPEGFCGQAWHDMYHTIMMYYWGGDYEYPEPGVTYTPCGDGIRPVIFRIESHDH